MGPIKRICIVFILPAAVTVYFLTWLVGSFPYWIITGDSMDDWLDDTADPFCKKLWARYWGDDAR